MSKAKRRICPKVGLPIVVSCQHYIVLYERDPQGRGFYWRRPDSAWCHGPFGSRREADRDAHEDLGLEWP